jgi:leader peptidase (prepilin peptidase)/N-methyltransferase
MSVDVAIGTALLGAVSGPALARASYELSVPFGAPTRTACRHCETQLSGSPISWFGWAGRCHTCRRSLGPRVWLVALVAALAGALVGVRIGNDPAVVVFTAFALLCVLLAFVDIAVQRLPDVLTGPLAVLGVVGLGTTSYLAQDATPMMRGVIGAALAGGFFLTLAWLRPDGQGMGLGDAKLAGVLGLYLGWLSWKDLTLGIIAGSLLAMAYAVAMMAAGRMDRKSSVTYGPFLLLGAALALLLG